MLQKDSDFLPSRRTRSEEPLTYKTHRSQYERNTEIKSQIEVYFSFKIKMNRIFIKSSLLKLYNKGSSQFLF